MKPIYTCTAAMLTILAGAVLFTPHVMNAGPGSATTAKSTVSQAAKPAQRMRLAEDYGKLPLSFEANQGQVDTRVKFLSRGRGYSLFLTEDEAVLKLERASQMANGKSQMANVKNENGQLPLAARPLNVVKDTKSGARDQGQMTKDTILRMKLVGANAGAAVTGADELPGKSNYFIGNDPKKWHSNVPTYAEVKYKAVYPGVDLVYYGNQGGQLEYDFVVAPGADPNVITLDVGADGVRPTDAVMDDVHRTKGGRRSPLQIAADGDLVVNTDGGQIRFHKPIVYQTDLTTTASSPSSSFVTRHSSLVHARYTLDAQNRVRFQVAPYDHSKPLFIDPMLSYSTYLGGSSDDRGEGIAVDSSGNTYVTGFTLSADFPIVNPLQVSNQGGDDAFVVKLNATGSALVYSTYLGGSGDDQGSGIAVDSSGNAYVTGVTDSTNFPIVNPLQASFGGGVNDAFVSKLSPDGSALVYSTYLGGNSDDQGYAIAVDSSGNAFVAGTTFSTNFPTVSPIQATNRGGYDAFVSKLNAAGSALVYSTYLGGNSEDIARGITIDLSDDAYVTGMTNSTDFPIVNPLQATKKGADDAFVAKLNDAGSALVYSTYLGGSGEEDLKGGGIAVDSSGNAYVTGDTFSQSDFPTVNPFQATFNAIPGDPTAYVAKLNPTGSALVYSTYLGGSQQDVGRSIAVDSFGDAYVAGWTASADFPSVNPVQASYGGGSFDAFVTVFNAAGSALIYSTYLGGSGSDLGLGIAVDSYGNAYLTGETSSTDFPTVNPMQVSYGGGIFDAFVAKLTSSPAVSLSPTSLTFGPQDLGTTSAPQTVTLMNTGNSTLIISSIVVSGDFAQSNNCGSLVAAQASCAISVVFGPSLIGTRIGDITITDNANQSPQIVPLTGTGINPGAALSPTSLSFGKQVIDTSSAAMKVTLTSTGTTNLIISGISFTGINPADFSQTNNCPASMAPSSQCTINVLFTPIQIGLRTATLAVADNAANTPQTAQLSAVGVPPAALSPTAWNFGNLPQNTSSGSKKFTLTNYQIVALNISSISINNSDFAQTNTCGSTIPAKGNCTISVTFTPSIVGAESGTLTAMDDAFNSPQTASLTGKGIVQAKVYPTSMTFAPQKVNTTSGAKVVTLTNNLTTALTSISITFTGANPGDFGQTNTCGASLPAKSNCKISVTFTPTAKGPRTATVDVNDSANNSPQTVSLTGTGK
jgi:hypothetical protein